MGASQETSIGGKPVLEEILTLGVYGYRAVDPGDGLAIDVTRPCFTELATGAGGETRTLGDPSYRGQEIDLTMVVDGGGGDCVVTAASPINQTGNNTMTFADVGDHIRLIGFYNPTDGWEWRVICNDGVALSTV